MGGMYAKGRFGKEEENYNIKGGLYFFDLKVASSFTIKTIHIYNGNKHLLYDISTKLYSSCHPISV